MTVISNKQLAAVLQRAANYRRDVRRAAVVVAEDRPDLLLVEVDYYTDGRRVQRESQAEKCLDGRTCGQILEDWLGPTPKPTPAQRQGTNAAVNKEAQRYLDNTPQAVLEMQQDRQKNPPPTPPRSKFNWKPDKEPRPEVPKGTMPAGPEDPTTAASHPPEVTWLDEKTVRVDGVVYRELNIDTPYCPIHGDLFLNNKIYKPTLTKQQMLDKGWNEQRRAMQYRTQGGKHPDDLE